MNPQNMSMKVTYRVRWMVLIRFACVYVLGDPPRRQGDVATKPTCGPLLILCVPCSEVLGPPRRQG